MSELSIIDLVQKESPPNFTEEDITSLYSYRVPKLREDGLCSFSKNNELEPKAFDLRETFNLTKENVEQLFDHPTTILLWRLKRSLELLKKQMAEWPDWIGIYQRRKIDNEEFLIKLSYQGKPSRAVFPLNEKWAKLSNNSNVAMLGKERILQNTHEISFDTPYYSCDHMVRSEACLPIKNSSDEILGIIDAESFKTDFFTQEIAQTLREFCSQIGNKLF
ncbi:free methionine-r-sulfoxide reductase [Anaeramoeba flamelloides]|uniref:Free methionine-r-sulfoxide reductase n=1 Tax=Anaeramoeba flamelloides TaxID=1746091 RepID=A0AAV7YTE3_9EUKA|nr:free methionine-r-sulfoxide reductase [Anaeramoeba flamelloides]